MSFSTRSVGRSQSLGVPSMQPAGSLASLEQMMRRFGRIIPKAVLEEKLYAMDEEPDRMDHQAGICNCASCGARRKLEIANATAEISSTAMTVIQMTRSRVNERLVETGN